MMKPSWVYPMTIQRNRRHCLDSVSRGERQNHVGIANVKSTKFLVDCWYSYHWIPVVVKLLNEGSLLQSRLRQCLQGSFNSLLEKSQVLNRVSECNNRKGTRFSCGADFRPYRWNRARQLHQREFSTKSLYIRFKIDDLNWKYVLGGNYFPSKDTYFADYFQTLYCILVRSFYLYLVQLTNGFCVWVS